MENENYTWSGVVRLALALVEDNRRYARGARGSEIDQRKAQNFINTKMFDLVCIILEDQFGVTREVVKKIALENKPKRQVGDRMYIYYEQERNNS